MSAQAKASRLLGNVIPEVYRVGSFGYGSNDKDVVIRSVSRFTIGLEISFFFVIASGVRAIEDDHFDIAAGFADEHAEPFKFGSFVLRKIRKR